MKPGSNVEKVEYAELNKIIRKCQKEDNQCYSTDKVRRAIEENSGVRRAKENLQIGRHQIFTLKEAN